MSDPRHICYGCDAFEDECDRECGDCDCPDEPLVRGSQVEAKLDAIITSLRNIETLLGR